MQEQRKYRVVIDTNEIIAAGSKWLPPGCPDKMAAWLVYTVAHNHIGLYSSDIIGEYITKLLDRRHPPNRVIEYIGCILNTFEKVDVNKKDCSPRPCDPDDIKFLLCALEGKANYLVTEDRHLLDLKEYYDLPIISRLKTVARELGIPAADESE